MAADPVFIDTNVPVYATRRTASEHAAARALTRQETEVRRMWVSGQILRESPAAVTRPQATDPALPIETAIADVRRFQQVFDVAEDSPIVLDRLLALLGAHHRAGRQVYDANIVATLLEHGVRRLLIPNAADFRRFAGIIEPQPYDDGLLLAARRPSVLWEAARFSGIRQQTQKPCFR